MCVLLVEDEWITLLAAEAALAEAGLNVLAVESGQQAVGYIDRHPGYFSCLVTDFHMLDGVTGAHVIEHMRTAYLSIPMILTSALTHVVTGGWRLQFGVDLLPKPYDMADLVMLVRRLTSRSRSSD